MGVSVRRTTGSIPLGLLSALVPIWLIAIHGCVDQIPVAPAAANKEPTGCRVVRRYHHAGKPELEADVRKLLDDPSKRVLSRNG